MKQRKEIKGATEKIEEAKERRKSIASTALDRVGKDEYPGRYCTRCMCLWIAHRDFKMVVSILIGQKKIKITDIY